MTKAIANTIAGLAGLTTEQTNEFINKSNIIDKYINVNIEQTTAFKMGDTEVNIKKTTLDALTDLDGSGNGVLYKDTDTSVTPNVDYYRVSTDYQLIVHTKSYEDGSAPDYVYEMVKLADGTRTDVSDKIKALPGTELEMFLGGCKGTKASQYTTTEDVTKEDTVDGQYVVELTELIDIANGKTAMDISVLGDTKRSLVYDTGDGKFKSIGEDGQTAYDLHLSAIGNAGQFKDINIDFSATKNVSNEGTSTIGMKAGDEDGAGAGKLLGALKGVAVDSNGKIYGSYDNGNTELLGQIAVTEFANASGLEKVGENLYQTTLNSGEFDGIGRDISSLSGSMSTGVLEMSNVDLSAEFTDMITTQRGFQANSRIITTSDTLLEELINLKR
ncbi:MAG: flagellar hook-basal body complex protein [Lachnospiraceae bacterium]|nr:flagellar hook-basal body complex protein [Lachnospiraceae bacterium]